MQNLQTELKRTPHENPVNSLDSKKYHNTISYDFALGGRNKVSEVK